MSTGVTPNPMTAAAVHEYAGSPDTLRTVLELAAREVFDLMVGSSLADGSKSPAAPPEVTAMVGLAGSLCGMITIRCSEEASQLMAAKMLGIPESEASSSSRDAVAEITNMIAGNFKTKLSGVECMLSIPTIITGADYQMRSLDVGRVIQIALDFGDHPIQFALEIHS